MQEKINKMNKFLNVSLSIKSRILVFFAFAILIPSFFTPLWTLHFGAQQYPEGLELFIYADKMVGGNDGNDLTEINVLNHYIGMAELKEEDFTEFKWIPLVLSLVIVLTLRAAFLGKVKSLVDILVSMAYFAGFSTWRFWYMLHSYGHNLDPKAAVKVAPFTPPIFGSKMVGQFSVDSYPGIAVLFFSAFGILIIFGIYHNYKMNKIVN